LFCCSSWGLRQPTPKIQAHSIQSLCRRFRIPILRRSRRENCSLTKRRPCVAFRDRLVLMPTVVLQAPSRSHCRLHVAGHASIAQSLLGKSQPSCLYRTARRPGEEGRLEWALGRAPPTRFHGDGKAYRRAEHTAGALAASQMLAAEPCAFGRKSRRDPTRQWFERRYFQAGYC
jgi:hypothetical protein